MKASTRAMMQKSSSPWASLPALILPANSSMSASGCAVPRIKLLVFGKSLSSMQTAATPRCSSLRTRRLMLLKLPYPVSPSRRIGTVVASAMNSMTSRTWVQLASLLSRTPSCAEIERPLPQIPLKPASSTIRAERPLWASQRNSRRGEVRSFLNCFVFFIGFSWASIVCLSARSPAPFG